MNAVLKTATTLARESMDGVFAEIQPLLKAHFTEIAHFKDIKLDPNWARYRKIEEAGALRIFTARLDGELVGYGIFCVETSMHYQASLQAIQDVLFVHPHHRESRVGISLIRYCDRMLKAEGVQVVRQHMKAKFNFSPILKRLGYDLEDLIYVKRLDR